VINSRRMRWAVDMRNAYNILVGKPEGRDVGVDEMIILE
jgi:hypothetical protein